MSIMSIFSFHADEGSGLIRLLWTWKGSVWKLVYRELLVFFVIYLLLALTYRLILPESLKK
ncbi:hypothetical protein B4U79_05903 [Dinothrombium tinctorium]|uniref:Bestrophin homolog n=1 Tax=Dinothrombium tinctorium TaxID=1965070 RepID=A0A3S3S0A8_9ACAR|nr:hypothetical protein B4U79_02155 [Dinothrombium tinctorium]RWS08572.1 hypothetical protein B4U79_05903 [Dinothrombium tinctorium]